MFDGEPHQIGGLFDAQLEVDVVAVGFHCRHAQESVSYTHLDVYKRQAVSLVRLAIPSAPAACA